MQLANSNVRYGAIPQTVHWLTFICVTVGWLLGWFLDDIPKGPARSFGLVTHMTLGQCVFVLVVFRLAWRFANPPPPPEKTQFGRLLEIAAKLSHFTMYGLLLLVPWLGIIVQLKRGDALPIFGVWHIASPWPTDRVTARSILKVHEYLAIALVSLAGIHAAAALIHHYVFRDRTLARMLPGAT